MIFWTAVAGAAIIVILLVLRPLLRGASEPEGEHTPDDAAKLKSIARTILKRQGKPQDIADAVIFLVQHPHITGHILNIDGGKSVFF